MENNESGFSFQNLLLGILSAIAAVIAFRNPAASLMSIVMVYGLFAIVRGIMTITAGNRLKKAIGGSHTLLFVNGIINLIFGILLLFNIEIGMITLPIIFALWFLVDSIAGIFRIKPLKDLNKSMYYTLLVIHIIGAIVGVLLISNPFSSMLTMTFLVGFYFMLSSIVYFVRAF